jgi:hypothetical protein
MYTRWEIIEQPTNTPAAFQIVYWKSISESPNLEEIFDRTFPELYPYRIGGTGSVVEYSTYVHDYHQYQLGVNLHQVQSLLRMGFCIIDITGASGTQGDLTSPAWGGSDQPWNSRALWLPMKLRVTIVAVAEGATFSGWDRWVANPPTDGYS